MKLEIFLLKSIQDKKMANFWFIQPKIEPYQKSFRRNWKKIRLLFIKI